jgi:hypothetical protein
MLATNACSLPYMASPSATVAALADRTIMNSSSCRIVTDAPSCILMFEYLLSNEKALVSRLMRVTELSRILPSLTAS